LTRPAGTWKTAEGAFNDGNELKKKNKKLTVMRKEKIRNRKAISSPQ
jgi:hypothetical protein